MSVLLVLMFSLFHQTVAGSTADNENKALLQKLTFLDSMINKGSTSKKVRNSNNEAAKQLLKQAEDLFALARANIDKGQYSETGEIINEAIRALSSANAKTKGLTGSTPAERSRYRELLSVIETLQENVDMTFENPVDLEKIRNMKAQAKDLAGKDKYADAIKILDSGYHIIATAISDNVRNTTVLYSLDFADSKEEYEWEHRRYNGNRELVMTMLNQRRQSPTRKLIVRYRELADSTLRRAEDYANNKQHDEALKAVEQANKDLSRAMGMLGLRF